MPETKEELARPQVMRQQELARRWVMALVEELFAVRVIPEFERPEVVMRDSVKKKKKKKQRLVVVAVSCSLVTM